MSGKLVDLDAVPYVDLNRGWKKDPVLWRTGGILEWNPNRMFPYFPVLPRAIGAPSQVFRQNRPGYTYRDGEQILHDIRDLPVLNATVLDFLIEHPEERPSWLNGAWLSRHQLCFWGTHYVEAYRGDRFIRCLRDTSQSLTTAADMLLESECWESDHAVAMYVGLRFIDALR